ncbi:hypothetical protein Hanom_Chr01g00083911 [Helianthus anomalus]
MNHRDGLVIRGIMVEEKMLKGPFEGVETPFTLIHSYPYLHCGLLLCCLLNIIHRLHRLLFTSDYCLHTFVSVLEK